MGSVVRADAEGLAGYTGMMEHLPSFSQATERPVPVTLPQCTWNSLEQLSSSTRYDRLDCIPPPAGQFMSSQANLFIYLYSLVS